MVLTISTAYVALVNFIHQMNMQNRQRQGMANHDGGMMSQQHQSLGSNKSGLYSRNSSCFRQAVNKALLQAGFTTTKGYMEGLQAGIVVATPEIYQMIHREAERLQRLEQGLPELLQAEVAQV